jgi:transcriptional regulator
MSLDYEALLAFNSDSEGDGMSQLEIAKLLGCTRQYVYQLEKRALRKLRASMECHGLTYESLAPLLRSL